MNLLIDAFLFKKTKSYQKQKEKEKINHLKIETQIVVLKRPVLLSKTSYFETLVIQGNESYRGGVLTKIAAVYIMNRI